MRDTKIMTLYKNKGERTDCNSYIGIFLFNIVGKIFELYCLTTTTCRTCISGFTVWFSFRPINSWHNILSSSVAENMQRVKYAIVYILHWYPKSFHFVGREGLFIVIMNTGCTSNFQIRIQFFITIWGVIYNTMGMCLSLLKYSMVSVKDAC